MRTDGAGEAVADDSAVAFVNAVYFAVDGPGYFCNAFRNVADKVADSIVAIVINGLIIKVGVKCVRPVR